MNKLSGVDTYDALFVRKPMRWPMIKVLANGCFDVLHDGHLQHLREAREMGDCLIVSLTEDAHVNKGPGRPINCWSERAELLKELRCVDGVVPARNACEAIRWIRPTIFVKGIDYAGMDKFTEDVAAACKEVGAELRFTTSAKKSASEIIRKAMK